jgi:hypothetical protein
MVYNDGYVQREFSESKVISQKAFSEETKINGFNDIIKDKKIGNGIDLLVGFNRSVAERRDIPFEIENGPNRSIKR